MAVPGNRRWAVCAALAVVAVVPGRAAVGGSAGEDRATELNDACIHEDREALERLEPLLREAVEAEPTSALAHYEYALLRIRQSMVTNGSVDSRDRERSRVQVAEAVRHLQEARRLDPSAGRVYAALSLCHWFRFMLGQESPSQVLTDMQEVLQAGTAACPEQSFVRLMAVLVELSGPQAARQLETLEDDCADLFEGLRERLREADTVVPDFWDLFCYGMAARSFVFLSPARPDVAAEWTAEALEWEPEFTMARDFLAPFVAVRHEMPAEEWSERDWIERSADPPGDGLIPILPDATGLQHSPDPEFLWVRIPLAQAPPDDALGVNLVVQADDVVDSSEWWGGHKDVAFDRLVTVWVARDAAGQWRGAVGISRHAEAFAGAMTQVLDGGVGFAVDRDSPALVLRVPWQALEDEGVVRLRGAVGSNAQWNDDVPDRDTVEFRRDGGGR